jgi:hypothetical protein
MMPITRARGRRSKKPGQSRGPWAYTEDDIRQAVRARGGVCREIRGLAATDGLVLWCRHRGHPEFESTPPKLIKLNRWCRACFADGVRARAAARRLEAARAIAAARGGQCLSRHVPPVYHDSDVRWRCAAGHHFRKTVYLARKLWCNDCNNIAGCAAQLADIKALAAERGGACLSAEYVDSQTHLEWRCRDGHEWPAIPNAIRRGGWCPICAQSIGERVCRVVLEQIFGRPFPSAFPNWLCHPDTGRILQLDGYNRHLRIAFEYQGAQHEGRLHRFSRDRATTAAIRQRDGFKAARCAQKGVRLIRVAQFTDRQRVDPAFVLARLIEAIRKAGVRVPRGASRVVPDLNAAFRASQLERLRDRAAELGGRVASAAWAGYHTTYQFVCREGHDFARRAVDVLGRGRWCRTCEDNFYTEADCHAYAARRGGRCLVRHFVNGAVKIPWVCTANHRWEQRPNIMIPKDTWCRQCAPARKRATARATGLERVRSAGAALGFLLVSTTYEHSGVKLSWTCRQGHPLEATLSALRAWSWCRHAGCPQKKRPAPKQAPLTAAQRQKLSSSLRAYWADPRHRAEQSRRITAARADTRAARAR